jgi:superfamily II DNA or RNA helicase
MSASDLGPIYDEFQSDAVDAIVKDFENRKTGRYLLVIPTGGGKTWAAVKAINSLFQNKILNSESDRVLWVTHRVELEGQAKGTFLKYAEDKKNSESYEKNVTYVRDLKKIKSRVSDPRITFVVIDEAHHSAASSYQPIFNKNSVGVLGLTATPSRHDGQPLDFDKESYSIGFPDLVQKRVILDPHIEPAIKTGYKDDEGDFEKIKENLNNSIRNSRIIEVLQERHTKYNKVVIYVGTKSHVKDLYEQIMKSPLTEFYPSINWILGGENDNSRDLPRDDFIKREKSEKKSILINIEVLTEGYDDPTIDTVVMACPMKSTLKYMQAAGRAVRRDEKNDDKKAYIVPVEDDLPNIKYRFDNRWLYSDISDALEPQVIDKTYSDEATFRKAFETLYNNPKTLVEDKDKIYPTYDKDNRFSVLLFKVYLSKGHKHLPVILNSENRLKFKSRFDFLSERLAHQSIDYNRNDSWAYPANMFNSFEALMSNENRRDIWDAMKFAGQCIENSPMDSPDRIKQQKPWITFVALRYKATEVSPDLSGFLEDMVNKVVLLEEIKSKNYEPNAKLVKLPLPLGRFKGLILNCEMFAKVERIVTELKELFEASENNDCLDKTNLYFESSDFPIKLKYKPCLPIIVREQLDYFMEL